MQIQGFARFERDFIPSEPNRAVIATQDGGFVKASALCRTDEQYNREAA